MANEKVKFTTGQMSNLDAKAKEAGQVLFAIGEDNHGVIYFDKDNSTRVQMGGKANSITVNGEQQGNVSLNTSSDAILTLKSQTFIVGTATTDGNWNGSLTGTGITSLYDGLVIDYWIPRAGASTTTLNLTLDSGQASGAKTIYRYGNTKLTTHYGVNNVLRMVYRSSANIGGTNYEGWWVLGDYDTNSFQQLRFQANIKAANEAIVAGNIIVNNGSGYFHLKKGAQFNLRYPILYAGSAIAANGTNNNAYTFIAFTVTTTQNITLTPYEPVFIKGTLSGGNFTPASTTPLTQTIPTAAETSNPHYVLLGMAYSTTEMYLMPNHPVYMYSSGGFGEVVNTALVALYDNNNKDLTTYVATGSISGETLTLKNGNGAKVTDITIPDKKVEQSVTTTSDFRPLVLGATHSTSVALTSTIRDVTYVSNNFYVKPSTGELHATKFVGDLEGTASEATHAVNADIAIYDSLNQEIISTYLADFTISNNNKDKVVISLKDGQGQVLRSRDIPAASTTTAGVITANTTTQTITGPKVIDANGSLEMKGNLTVSKSSGFNYTGIETGSSAGARPVWFSYLGANGKPVVNNNFTYDPSTKTLTVENITGTVTSAIKDGLNQEITATYIKYGTPAFNVTSSTGTFDYTDGNNRAGQTALPIATDQISGLMTAVAQTFAGIKTFKDRIVVPYNKMGISFREDNTNYTTGLVYGTSGNENLALVFKNNVDSFMIATNSDPASWGSSTWQSAAPSIHVKQKSLYVNTLIANGSNPSYNFQVTGTSYLNGQTTTEGLAPDANLSHNIGSQSFIYKELYTSILNLQRKSVATGGVISWYDKTFYNWYTYMQDAGNGHAPDGGKPSTLASVTSWAIRSMIENTNGYGWIWEAKAGSTKKTDTTSAATPLMALSSNTGKLYLTNDLNIIMGDTDKFVHYLYNYANTGGSWRAGVLGSGSGNTNYYVIQSTTHDTASTTWTNTLRIGQSNFDVTVGGEGSSFGIANTTTNTGAGISLYGGAPTSGAPNQGFFFAQTSAFGTHGKVTSDHALYSHITTTTTPAITSKGWIWRYNTTNVFSIDYEGYVTASKGMSLGGELTLKGGLELDGIINGTSYAYSGGGYNAAYNSIIMHGDATTGMSGLLFCSDKTSTTSINRTSDRAFIQFHPLGISAYKAEGTAPTENISGEANKLVIGVGNDSNDTVVIQTPGTNGLKHLVGTNEYTVLDSHGTVINNPNASNTTYSSAIDGYLIFSNTGDGNGVARGIGGVNGGTDGWTVRGYQTASNAGALELAVGDDGNEGIYVRQYTSGGYKLPFHNNAGANSGLSYRELILMAPSTGYTTIPQKLYITGDGSDISSSNANGGNLYIGQTTAQHLSFDTDEIASKTNASTMGTLKLQDDGGKVYIGGWVQGLISNAHYGTTASKGDKKYYKIGIKWQYAWMLTFTIRVYQAYNYFDLVISGYNYGSNNWYSPKASLLNASGINSLSVKFGYDSENKTPLQNGSYKKLWIMIPADDYTGLDIIDVTNGYQQATVPGDLFTIEEVTVEPDGTNEVVQQTINAMAPARISEDTISANTAKDNRIVRWDVQSGKPLSLQSSGVTIDDGDNVTPEVDQAANMGTATYRWKGVYGATIYGTSLAGTWLQGQNTENRVAFAVSKATDTGSYWPWMRQENSGSGRWFSLGVLNNSFYIVGSATARTANGVDHQWCFDVSNGMFSTQYLRVNSEDMSSVANATYDNTIPQALFAGVTKFNNRVYFANATLNVVGDDATLGDVNLAGHIGLKGINGNTGLAFLQYVASKGTTIDTTDATTGKITWNGSKFTINKPTEIVLSGVTSTTVNALYVAGRTQLGSNSAEAPNETLIHGKIVIDPQYSGSTNSYNEGLRINRASNNWATIALGGAKDTKSGTGTDVWLVGSYGTTNSDFYIRRNGSSGTTAPGINGGTNGFSVHNRLYINHACGTDFNLSVSGNAQVLNGILYIDKDTTTANINTDAGAASIVLRVKATEQSNTQGGSYIRAFQTPTATNYNQALAIWSTGSMFIGGGESANTIRAEVNKASGDENLYLCADSDVVFYPAADGKKCYLRLNSATLRPETNVLLDLGTTGQRWKTGYFNALDMGSIATNAASDPTGKITWAGGTDAADIYYQLDAADQGNLVFNMRDDANALTAFAYNGTKNIYINPNTTSIYPRVDNSGNLGLSDHRWKNLYLSGGIRTQSAQALYVGSAQRSQWYKITLPEHGTAATTLSPEGSSRWYMHSMTIIVGGDYNANPRGQIELKHYVYWNGSAWSLDKSYATMVGPDIEKITIYYKLAEPFIIYINTSNAYSSIWVEHLQGLDTAQSYDPLNTKVETIAAITVDANYTKVPTVSWGNNSSYKDGWYTPNSIVMVNNSSDNSRDAVLYIENQSDSDWAEKIYLNTNKYGLYIYGTNSNIAQFGANDILHINDSSTVGNRNVSIKGRLDLNRVTSNAFGRISYYSPSYRTWYTYMSDASNGSCPTGGKPGSLGNVTSWAYRNIIQNASGYGWVWEAATEAAASANTTEPTVRMALSSYTGQLRIAPNASSTTCETGGLIIDGAKNASNGNVAIELWRGTAASWQIANESGTLHIRDNYNASGKQSTYVDTQISMVYNSGNITITKGSVTMANSIYITKAGECGLEVNNTQATNPNQVAFIVGSSGNGGIYSRKHSKWVVYSDASGNVVLNGNANTATALTSSAGSTTQPIYFKDGKPVAITGAIANDITGNAATATAFSSNATVTLTGDTTGTASSTKGWSIATTTNLHQTNWDFTTTQPLSKYTTFDKSNPVGAPTQTWYNGFVSSHNNYLASYIVNAHRSANWYVGYGEWSSSTKTAAAPTWYKLLHSGNYNDYSPTLTGTGASGTWGISISGNAATATALRDRTNNTTTYANYGASAVGLSSITYLAAWNGYELRAINKSELIQNLDSYDSHIAWGNQNAAGVTKPIDAGLNERMGAQRFAGIAASRVTIQYSTDGSTWTDYGASDATKRALFTQGTNLRVIPNGTNCTNASRLKITLNCSGAVYTELRRIHFDCSTNYSNGCKVTIKASLNSDPDNFTHTICEAQPFSGWSGWNIITSNLTVGSGSSQYAKLQFLFYQDSITSGKEANGFTIYRIWGYGGYGWTTPSTLAATGHIYEYDQDLIASFPNIIKQTSNGNTFSIGAQDTGFTHLYNSANIPFIFNNSILQTGGTFGNTTYKCSNAYTAGWWRTIGNGGWYSETYGGGWHMTDSTYIRNYGSKHLYINAEIVCASANAIRFVGGSGTTKAIIARNDGSNFYLLCANAVKPGDNWYTPTVGGHPFRINLESGIVYCTKVYGAVWNDYAEHRQTVNNLKWGQVVAENGDGTQHITTQRLELGCNISSDTFGTSLGEREDAQTPIAVAGRVLAYPNENKEEYKPGDAVCSGPNGTVSKMTRREIRRYPDAIIGYVSEIPDYDIWYAGENRQIQIKVNGRIWIKVN